jgi:hypothetical protein
MALICTDVELERPSLTSAGAAGRGLRNDGRVSKTVKVAAKIPAVV